MEVNEKERNDQLYFLPFEEEEKHNPKLALYNEIARHAFTYNQDFFPIKIKDSNTISKIFHYVKCDFPELFWLDSCEWNSKEMRLIFRCTIDGKFDVAQVEKKRNELRKAAKKFTKGITKKTPPYEALLTIYRRLILTLDYDGVKLKSNPNTFSDLSKDDVLRSLYSALVEHKVVCAGYAYALQYLLQTIGITCGYVISESVGNSSHAFNALKIGKFCYYLDATWGDKSNTLTGEEGKYDIYYDYVCVPYDEFKKTPTCQEKYHEPSRTIYPPRERFKCIAHEYFRHIGAYIENYDEEIIADIFARAAIKYDKKEMGRFSVHFKCSDIPFRDYVVNKILVSTTFDRIIKKAIGKCGMKSHKATKLFTSKFIGCYPGNGVPTAYFIFDNLKH